MIVTSKMRSDRNVSEMRTYLRMYVLTYVCIDTQITSRIHVRTYPCTHAHTHISPHVCIRVDPYQHTHATRAHTVVRTYTFITTDRCADTDWIELLTAQLKLKQRDIQSISTTSFHCAESRSWRNYFGCVWKKLWF